MTVKIIQPRYKTVFKNNDEKAELARLFWAEAVEHLEQNGFTTKTRLATADRYVRARVEFEFLSPIALEEGPVKEGPNGGDVFNFNWSAVKKLGDEILKYEESLLISPKAAGGVIINRPPTKPAAADEFLED
jgi:hypothetical protein